MSSPGAASSADTAAPVPPGIQVPPSLRRVFYRVDERLDRAQSALRLTTDDTMRMPLPLEIAIVGVLTLIALFFRTNNLADIPPGIHGDESLFTFDVKRILEGGWISIWTDSTLGAPTGHLYFAAPFFLIGGQSVEMLRVSVALLGAALIPAAHVLLRQLFGLRIALSAAAMLTFCVWFVAQSRIGWHPMPSVFMFVFAMCILVASLRSARLWLAALAGLVFGLGLYTYTGYLIYFALTTTTIAILMAISKELRARKEIYWFLGVSLTVASSMLLHYFTEFNIVEKLNNHYGVSTSLPLTQMVPKYLDRAWELFMLVHNPTDDGLDGVGGIPIFSPLLIRLLFWIGLAATLLFINKRPYQILLIGWLIAMAPAILVPGGESRRYLLGIFFLIVIVSIGLSTIVQILTDWIRRSSAQDSHQLAAVCAPIVMAAFLGLFALTNYRDFNNWAVSPSARWYFGYELVNACERLQKLDDALDPHYELRFYSVRVSAEHSTVRWLLPGVSLVNGSTEFGGDGTALSGGDLNGDTVFLLLENYATQDKLKADIEAAYPNGRWYDEVDDNGRTMYAAYVIDTK